MSVHHSDTNQSNEYASTNLLSLVLIASSRLSSLLCFLCLAPRATRSSLPCACASSTALRAGLPSKSPLRRPLSRREAQSTRLLRNMLALATKLQQGATHGTFTRQEDLAILAVVLATAALAGGIVVAACLLCGSSVGVLRVASRLVLGIDVVVRVVMLGERFDLVRVCPRCLSTPCSRSCLM